MANNIVAIPLPAKVLLPVEASAELYNVSPDPCAIVISEPLELTIVIASPPEDENTLAGIVTVPLVVAICLPESEATRV